MSYCRFLEADAYIYASYQGLECSGCIMAPTEKYPTPYIDMFGIEWEEYSLPVGPFETAREMLEHIQEHRNAGHNIPAYVDRHIKEDYPDLDASLVETEEERLAREERERPTRERIREKLRNSLKKDSNNGITN